MPCATGSKKKRKRICKNPHKDTYKLVYKKDHVCAVCLVAQSCPTFCNPMDYSPTAHQAPLSMGILQARILEWVAMPSFRGSSQPTDRTQVSHIAGGFFTVQATRKAQEYWSGQPIPSPGDLLDPGIELGSPALQVDSVSAEIPRKPKNDYAP